MFEKENKESVRCPACIIADTAECSFCSKCSHLCTCA